ncbi:MAG: CbiX/SirB N-terminal domain-containing protein [Candidatus Nanopelagicales bacterium]
MSLTLLAHGSPDSRHARDVGSLAGRLKVAGVPTSVAYLDHHGPTPAQAAQAWVSGGVRATTVVPLLVAPAFHVRVDAPAAVRAMRAAAPELEVDPAEPVGLHPLLVRAAAELLAASGLPITPGTGIILAAAGSRDLRAVAAMEALFRTEAPALATRLGARAVRTAYLDGGRPLGRIRTLMRCVDGAASFVVVPMVIAEGILRDRIVAAAHRHDIDVTPGALTDTNALAELVIRRARSSWGATTQNGPATADAAR